jgi:hypothetical protein
VRHNAVKHGLTGGSTLFSTKYVQEDPEAYATLRDEVSAYYQAQGVIEYTFVERIAWAMWSLGRVRATEAGMVRKRQNDILKTHRERNLDALDHDLRELELAAEGSRDRAGLPDDDQVAQVSAALRLGLRQYSEGVRHLMETIDLSMREIERTGFLSESLSQRLDREFGARDGELFGKILAATQRQGGHGVSHGADEQKEPGYANGSLHGDSDNRVSLSKTQQKKVIQLLKREREALDGILVQVESQEDEELAHQLAVAAIPSDHENSHLQRYVARHEKALHRALDALRREQRDRRGDPPPPEVDVNLSLK